MKINAYEYLTKEAIQPFETLAIVQGEATVFAPTKIDGVTLTTEQRTAMVGTAIRHAKASMVAMQKRQNVDRVHEHHVALVNRGKPGLF